MYDINFWPILVASIVSFAIMALWYSPILFGKEWMALTKMSEKDLIEMKARGMWKLYITHFIATLVSFCVLAFAIVVTNSQTAVDGAMIGFLVWLGFIATMAMSDLIWRRSPLKLVAIDTINVLLGFVIGGAIIGAWK